MESQTSVDERKIGKKWRSRLARIIRKHQRRQKAENEELIKNSLKPS